MYSPERQAGGTVIVGEAYTVEYAFLDDERPKIEGHYVRTALLYLLGTAEKGFAMCRVKDEGRTLRERVEYVELQRWRG